jgi:hypothetical protein
MESSSETISEVSSPETHGQKGIGSRKNMKEQKSTTIKKFMKKLRDQQRLSRSITKIFVAHKEMTDKKKPVDPLMLRQSLREA